ncbi:MAG: acyl-CoA dehydrogenase [Deltaproteobacteria bacterium RBG_13_61_14]|nr:MAG: acyl-CoA dehydrogenase [Deltaproteobacteria bacterium RBG_13_61_14]
MFDLSEEQKMIQDMVRDFAQNEVRPRAEQIDRTHEFPADLVKKMAELGLMGVEVPEQWGGAGMDPICYAIAVEEVSAACGSTGVILSAHNSLACAPIAKFGTDAQKEKHLKPLASGQAVGCFGLTEPSAGSDAGAIKTRAELKGKEWIINGTKIFITNGKEAKTCVLFARSEDAPGHRGMSAFIVPTDAPGFAVGKLEEKLGIVGSSTAELVLEDCRIPGENLLGERGQGFKVAMFTLDGGRIGIAAQAVGIARGALEAAVAFSKERVQFGKPIAEFQAIQWMLADMATEIDAARLLLWRAAAMKKAGVRYSKESAMCKLYAAEAAERATTKAVQIHGGYGYVKDYPVERFFRDARITSIYEGTSEIQRLVIANSLLKE